MAYRGTIRTILVRNVDMAASLGGGVRIPIPSRCGSPSYEVVGMRITVVSGTTVSAAGCTFNVTSDTGGNYAITGGNGNVLFSGPLNMNGSTPGETRAYTPTPSAIGGQGGGSNIWGASWLQSSPSLWFRCTAFVTSCSLVVDIQLDIRDVGQLAAPTVTDNAMARIRCVNTLAVTVSRAYIVGTLLYMLAPNLVTREGTTKNNVAVFDLTTGATQAFNFTVAGGSVLDFAVDAATGDIYIGGSFTSVNGTARNRIACVDSTGTLKAWNPGVSGDRIGSGNVRVSRVLVVGSVVYFFGNFTTVAGSTRNMGAAVDTGATLQGFNPNMDGSHVLNLDIPAACVFGSNIIVGGNITTVGATGRNCLAQLDGSTGAATSWAPSVGTAVGGTSIKAVVADASNVWSAGTMTTAPARPGLAKFDAAGGLVTAFQPSGMDNANPPADAYVDGSYVVFSATNNPSPPSRILDKVTGVAVASGLFQPGIRAGGIAASTTLGILFMGNGGASGCITLERYSAP